MVRILYPLLLPTMLVNLIQKPRNGGLKLILISPTVSGASISVNGGTGTGGAFRIGDIVHVTWDNSATGDNNPDIITARADLSELGEENNLQLVNSAGTYSGNSEPLESQSLQWDDAKVTIQAIDDSGNSTNGSTPSTISVNLFPFAVLADQLFNEGYIAVGSQTDLTFFLSNPNRIAANGISFTAILPSGLNVSAASASQCAGSIDISTPSQVTFSGGSLAADDMLPGGEDDCEIVTTVQAMHVGSYIVESFQVPRVPLGRMGRRIRRDSEVLLPPPVLDRPGRTIDLAWVAADFPGRQSTSNQLPAAGR